MHAFFRIFLRGKVDMKVIFPQLRVFDCITSNNFTNMELVKRKGADYVIFNIVNY